MIEKDEPTRGSPAYELCEFSLSNEQKELLRKGLLPYIDRDIANVDIRELASLIVEAIPSEILEKIKDVLDRKIDAPVIIHNLPETVWENGFAKQVQKEPVSSLNHSMEFWVSRGILEATGCEFARGKFLLRKQNDPHREHLVHRDRNPVSILSAMHNPIHAETQFVNMEAMLASLSSDLKNRLKIKPMPAFGVFNSITLSELESRINALRYDNTVAAHGFALENPSDGDKQIFENAVSDHMISVDLQPGTLVLWDTMYHRAREGKKEIIVGDGEYNRAVMFVGAARN